jgi:hypothetical protein
VPAKLLSLEEFRAETTSQCSESTASIADPELNAKESDDDPWLFVDRADDWLITKAFRKAYNEVTLCTSPCSRFPPPYLLTPSSSVSPVLQYLPTVVHYSPTLFPSAPAMPASNDCLNPKRHQQIEVLITSGVDQARPCAPPKQVNISFYSENDVTLGYYLENDCLAESFHCASPSCDVPLERHSRNIVHSHGRLTIRCVCVWLKS